MSRSSRTSLVNVQPMPRIAEDDDSPPPTLPEKSYQRSNLGRFAFAASSESLPDRRASLYRPGLRDTRWLARRGGWFRAFLILSIIAVLAIGLGVGLTIGLRRKWVFPSPPLPLTFKLTRNHPVQLWWK
jgi:hypothetical protein